MITIDCTTPAGHGPVIREKSLEKIDEYISHRDLREKEIYSVLQEAFVEHEYNEQNRKHAEKVSEENKVTSPIFNFEYGYNKSLHPEYRTSWEVMSKVYGSLPIFVKFSAQQNCLHHLNKLLKEKKVCFLYPDFWKLNNKIKQ